MKNKVIAIYNKNNPDLKIYPKDENNKDLRLVDDEAEYKIDKKDK